jgi:hypothetical protein
MNSPFPGMDPYLEQHWGDVHHSLVTYARDQLQAVLPGDLRARMQERVVVETGNGTVRTVYPDVRVVKEGPTDVGTLAAVGGVAVAEPLLINLPDEPMTEGFIEIIDVSTGNRIITVIEFLSLAHKTHGPGQDLYLQKQREIIEGRVSLVEIDLLRGGQRVLYVPEWKLPLAYRTPYRVCVRRGWRAFEAEVYRLPLREPLPAIRIPLRETDADAPLNLQALVDLAYRNGRYDTLEYTTDPDPPLDPADAGWADALLREKGLR